MFLKVVHGLRTEALLVVKGDSVIDGIPEAALNVDPYGPGMHDLRGHGFSCGKSR